LRGAAITNLEAGIGMRSHHLARTRPLARLFTQAYRFVSRGVCPRPAVFALLLGFACLSARAEVVLDLKNGRRIIGESIKSSDDETVEISIYRGFSKKVPRKVIANQKDIDRTQSDDREEFARRLKALAPDDVEGRVRLAEWARGKGLGIMWRGILRDLKERFPKHAAVSGSPFPEPCRSDEQKAFLRKQVSLFFGKPEERKQALESLRGKDVLPLGDVEEWGRTCFESARKGRKVKAGDICFKHPEFEGKVHIECWRKNGGKGKGSAAARDADARWPVLIALHGGGRKLGHWKLGGPDLFKNFRRHFDRMILIAPNVLQKRYAEWGGNPKEEFYVRELFKAVKRTWKIDTNRVYMGGTSMGGYGTWQIGGHQADLFAGLVSGAGGILIGTRSGATWGWGVIGNLMHTPIAFVHGGKDKPAPPWSDAEADRILTALAKEHPGCYRHKYLFYPKSGHGVPRKGMSEAVAWTARFKRDPYPKKVLWEPRRTINKQFYWLRTEEPRVFSRLEGEIQGNAVRLKTQNILGGLSVLLNKHLVDMAKPVTVEIGGQCVFKDHVRPTLGTILETVDARIDEQQWYSVRIDF
jgi:hypothetical protein